MMMLGSAPAAPPEPPSWSSRTVLPEAEMAEDLRANYREIEKTPWFTTRTLHRAPDLPFIPPPPRNDTHGNPSLSSSKSSSYRYVSSHTPSLADQRQQQQRSAGSSRYNIPKMMPQAVLPGNNGQKFTVYVGKIPSNVSDAPIMRLLRHCGPLIRFDRFKDRLGRPKSFGFAEYQSEQGVMKAIRCLNDIEVEGNSLVVKCDTETSKLVDAHAAFREHQEKLFDAFPHLKPKESETQGQKDKREEYPGQFSDQQTRRELEAMAREVKKYEAQIRREQEIERRREEQQKRHEEQMRKTEEERTKADKEEKEKLEQKAILDELERQDKKRKELERKRLRKMKREASLESKHTSVIPQELTIQLTPGTRSLLSGEGMLGRRGNFSDDGTDDEENQESDGDEDLPHNNLEDGSFVRKRKTTKALGLGGVSMQEVPEVFDSLQRQKQIPLSRKQALIKEIPTQRKHVYSYPIDWKIYDKFKLAINIPLAKFVTEKVQEYIGQEEQSMTDYIMDKVKEHAPAQELHNDLHPVLDTDTEVFILKLYRLIIFETEKLKL